MLELGLQRKKKKLIKPTDIIVFRAGKTAGHLGIMIDEEYFLHADGTKGVEKVIRRRLDDRMKKRILHVFKFPGTE